MSIRAQQKSKYWPTAKADAVLGPRAPRARVMSTHYPLLADQVCGLSHMIDTSASFTDCDTETILWRRCTKVAEETGEVISALIGVTGSNPRKGVTHTMGDVEAELLDVALSALCAVAHLHDNESDPVLLLAAHTSRVHARLKASIEATS